MIIIIFIDVPEIDMSEEENESASERMNYSSSQLYLDSKLNSTKREKVSNTPGFTRKSSHNKLLGLGKQKAGRNTKVYHATNPVHAVRLYSSRK